MELKVNVELTPNQEALLLKINLDNGYEPIDSFDEEEDDLQKLCELGLVESILGEQFYITSLGETYLNNMG